jgi:hypothetical protein
MNIRWQIKKHGSLRAVQRHQNTKKNGLGWHALRRLVSEAVESGDMAPLEIGKPGVTKEPCQETDLEREVHRLRADLKHERKINRVAIEHDLQAERIRGEIFLPEQGQPGAAGLGHRNQEHQLQPRDPRPSHGRLARR